VTCTPSREALLKATHLKKGTHITAVGSDTPDKQELDSAMFQKAHLVVADSIDQCLMRGEISQAIKSKHLDKKRIVELGTLISGKSTGRKSDEQISIADLTGVAVQDIKIAAAVYHAAVGP
jgi:ornithine cyclodeaminase